MAQPDTGTATITTRPEVVIEPLRAVETNGPGLIREERKLFLGELEDNVFAIFRKPSTGRDFFEEPPIVGSGYTARGWQTGVESFGAVFFAERMVLGQYTVDQASLETQLEVIKQYEEAFGRDAVQFVPGKYGAYRFWEDGNVRLMLVTSQGAKGVRSITVSIGHVNILNALRMNVESARVDLLEAARIIDSKGRLDSSEGDAALGEPSEPLQQEAQEVPIDPPPTEENSNETGTGTVTL